jgi:hypothetical protein
MALSGCVGPQGISNAERSFATAKRPTGMLVASLTVSGHTPGSMWLQLFHTGASAPTHSIPINIASFGLDWGPGSDASGRNIQGRLAAVEIPPGQYEFGRWVMTVANQAAYTSNSRIGARFSIREGEVVYVGNIHLDIQKSASASLPFRVEVNDERKRDLPLLARKYPELRPEAVRVEISASSAESVSAEPARGVRMEDLDGLIRPR